MVPQSLQSVNCLIVVAIYLSTVLFLDTIFLILNRFALCKRYLYTGLWQNLKSVAFHVRFCLSTFTQATQHYNVFSILFFVGSV